MTSNLRIDGRRLVGRLARLGQVGALPDRGVCRLALTEEDRQGRDLLVGWMKDLGLSVVIDRIGNIFGTRAGANALPPLMIGSHIDTVRTGGLYDGALGVLAGLEVVETLNDAGVATERPITVAAFTNEEGSRFQPDMMGSLVHVGGMDVEGARATVGIDGETVADCLDRIGYTGDLPAQPPEIHAFLELHVEQGPVLETEGRTIGIVEGVQGISWTEYTFEGTAAHAGTTPMAMRRDAGVVAARLAVAVREVANEMGGAQVGTVGLLALEPNLVNVIPDRAVMTVDLRNTDEAELSRAERIVAEHVAAVTEDEGVTVAARTLARFEPVVFDADLVANVEAEAMRLGFTTRRLPSGAGHDAQMLARVCPAAMIFVPSVGGLSHNVEEYTNDEDVTAGAAVLFAVSARLAGVDPKGVSSA
ncbi:MAG: Zn-dependent hydrolase [Hyphomicrobiales bacterium]|nr:Zn-dependent hydrolase [Hyphomicrobiales bacterium]